jgi:hypothetical protein
LNHASFKYVDRLNLNSQHQKKFNGEELKEMKRIRILDQKCLSIFKEIFIYIAFVVVLYEITFSNLSSSSMQYNFHFQNTFVRQQSSNEIGLNDVR